MLKKLAVEQRNWVDSVLNSLSMEERIAQLLLPNLGTYQWYDEIIDMLEHIPLGGVFVGAASVDKHRTNLARLQQKSRVPLLEAADLESGAGNIIKGGVTFTDMLAV